MIYGFKIENDWPEPAEAVVKVWVCAPSLFIVIPVIFVLIISQVLVPALSAANPGGLAPLLLKSSFIVVIVCLWPGSVIPCVCDPLELDVPVCVCAGNSFVVNVAVLEPPVSPSKS